MISKAQQISQYKETLEEETLKGLLTNSEVLTLVEPESAVVVGISCADEHEGLLLAIPGVYIHPFIRRGSGGVYLIAGEKKAVKEYLTRYLCNLVDIFLYWAYGESTFKSLSEEDYLKVFKEALEEKYSNYVEYINSL